MKRFFDLFISCIGILFLWPFILIGWIAASISTRSNGFFIQKRIGLGGCEFYVIKLKTMMNSSHPVSSITALNESRITSVGRILRKYKLDELPQLFNVLLGNMSFVGPRPDVAGYADKLVGGERDILLLRPGITGAATIYFKYEEELLNSINDPKDFNDSVIYPLKTKINLEYASKATILSDIDLIIQTLINKSLYSSTIKPFLSASDCRQKLESYKC
ncbi:TPA: sugar transferase [Photobacterium damselae]|uniref:sugar transferase n=1 Tax=Photobacterium damselae TaxID=38293 RepID=UPI0011D0A3DD|nr:sugar transferase [Photobacterium damselae]KAB1515167.1 sugar transferase [Photobacterium damselae subsp. damselae]